MKAKTVTFNDGMRDADPKAVDVLIRLNKLSGLIQACKAVAFKAANDKEMTRDPIDWEAFGHLLDYADVICHEAESAAEILHERASPPMFPRKGAA